MIDQISVATRFIDAIEKLVPDYCKNEEDMEIAGGNCSLYIAFENGFFAGKSFGDDAIEMRESGRVAREKGTQVLITKIASGKYEELVYSNQVDWESFGIMKPDFIGWEGGIPATLSDGTFVALAFSGFRGENDCEILRRASELIPELTLL